LRYALCPLRILSVASRRNAAPLSSRAAGPNLELPKGGRSSGISVLWQEEKNFKKGEGRGE
jgi:hypothetical protein